MTQTPPFVGWLVFFVIVIVVLIIALIYTVKFLFKTLEVFLKQRRHSKSQQFNPQPNLHHALQYNQLTRERKLGEGEDPH